jgi:hypothetical protein
MEGHFQALISPLHPSFLCRPFSGVPDLAGLHQDDAKKQPVDGRLMLKFSDENSDKANRQTQRRPGFKAVNSLAIMTP